MKNKAIITPSSTWRILHILLSLIQWLLNISRFFATNVKFKCLGFSFSIGETILQLINRHYIDVRCCEWNILQRPKRKRSTQTSYIEANDLVKIRTSPFLSITTPSGLLWRIWFCIQFSLLVQTWKRGPARSSLWQFQAYARCQWPWVRGHDPWRSHRKPFKWWKQQALRAERETRLYCTGAEDDAFCQSEVVCWKTKAISAFSNIQSQGRHRLVYENRQLGVNKLGDMMKIVSVGAELSQIYTKYSVRASAITLPFPTRMFQTAISFSFQGTIASKVSHTTAHGHL